MNKRYYDDGTVKQSDCNHPAYSLEAGELLCVVCGKPSSSKKWRTNIFGEKAAGEKAVEREMTENKGLSRPPEAKRRAR
jgi:hypothetical protein